MDAVTPQGGPLSSLPEASLPLSGTELMYLVQQGTSKQTTVSSVGGGGGTSGNSVAACPSRGYMAALNPGVFSAAYLEEAGREGSFVWEAGDFSANIPAKDPGQGIYVASTFPGFPTTAGCWVRKYSGLENVMWFGAVPDNVTVNDPALNNMITTLNADLIASMYFPNLMTGIYKINGPLSKITNSSILITGDEANLTIYQGTNGTFFQIGDYNAALNRRVYVTNLYIQCAGTCTPLTQAFVIDNCTECQIFDIIFNNPGGAVRVGFGPGTAPGSQCPFFTARDWRGSFNAAMNVPVVAHYAGANADYTSIKLSGSGQSTAAMWYFPAFRGLDTIRISRSNIQASDGSAYSLYVDCSQASTTNFWSERTSYVNGQIASVNITGSGTGGAFWCRHFKFIGCYIISNCAPATVYINNQGTNMDFDEPEFYGCTTGYSGLCAYQTITAGQPVRGFIVMGGGVLDQNMYIAAVPTNSTTATNPVVVNTRHGYNVQDGQTVKFGSISGATFLNGNSYIAKNPNMAAKTFQLYHLDGITPVDGTGSPPGTGGLASLAKVAAILLGAPSARIIGASFAVLLDEEALSNQAFGNTQYAVQTTADIDDFVVAMNEITNPTALRLEHSYATPSSNRIWSNNFGPGAGPMAAVTQATSKSTGVTLNAPSGLITMNSASLASGAVVSFVLTNVYLSANNTTGQYSLVTVNVASGATVGAYSVEVAALASGTCTIRVENISGGSLAEAVVLSFSVVNTNN